VPSGDHDQTCSGANDTPDFEAVARGATIADELERLPFPREPGRRDLLLALGGGVHSADRGGVSCSIHSLDHRRPTRGRQYAIESPSRSRRASWSLRSPAAGSRKDWRGVGHGPRGQLRQMRSHLVVFSGWSTRIDDAFLEAGDSFSSGFGGSCGLSRDVSAEAHPISERGVPTA
jgi:hypothetical protein